MKVEQSLSWLLREGKYSSRDVMMYFRSTPHPRCNRHHQDDVTFLGSGFPTNKPSFATGILGGE